MVRIRRQHNSWFGVALSAAAGLGAGLFAGMLVGGLMGGFNSERLRRALGRLGWRAGSAPGDLRALERAVEAALLEAPPTRQLIIRAHALGDGLVELTGTVPDATTRRAAGEAARRVPGADVVVNRLLVEGSETSVRQSAPPGTL